MTTEEQITTCENKLLDALKSGDIDMLDHLLHENLIFNIHNVRIINKAEDIDNYRSGRIKIT